MKSEFMDLCYKIIDASLYWTRNDEEKNPTLKAIRTLAGFYLAKYNWESQIDLAIENYLERKDHQSLR